MVVNYDRLDKMVSLILKLSGSPLRWRRLKFESTAIPTIESEPEMIPGGLAGCGFQSLSAKERRLPTETPERIGGSRTRTVVETGSKTAQLPPRASSTAHLRATQLETTSLSVINGLTGR